MSKLLNSEVKYKTMRGKFDKYKNKMKANKEVRDSPYVKIRWLNKKKRSCLC